MANTSAHRPDRFAPSFILISLSFVVLVTFIDVLGFWAVILIPLSGLSLGILLLLALGESLANRRWRRALSLCFACILALTAAVYHRQFRITKEWLHFSLWRHYYEHDVVQIALGKLHGKFKFFPWRETGFAGLNFSSALVYDCNRQLDQPGVASSKLWIKRAQDANALPSGVMLEGVGIWVFAEKFYYVQYQY